MRILAIALAFSAVAFGTHWIIWRVRIPSRQTATLLGIFLIVLGGGIASSAQWSPEWQFRSAWEVLHVATFHFAMTLAYVVAYSAIEQRSPSMTILALVADSGNRGQSREELKSVLQDISPVEIRLVAMVRDGMLREDGSNVVLTRKGRAWAYTFSTWRHLLRFGLGG